MIKEVNLWVEPLGINLLHRKKNNSPLSLSCLATGKKKKSCLLTTRQTLDRSFLFYFFVCFFIRWAEVEVHIFREMRNDVGKHNRKKKG
jgi:hypothetical protein